MPTTAGPTRSTTRTTASEYASRSAASSEGAGIGRGASERSFGLSRRTGFMAGGRAYAIGGGKPASQGGPPPPARTAAPRIARRGRGSKQDRGPAGAGLSPPLQQRATRRSA